MRAWQNALLHPAETTHLLALVASAIDAQRTAAPADRLWLMQGAAGALATLALCLEPIRFQKPKWVMHDLRHAKWDDLLKLIQSLYSGNKAAGATTAQVLTAIEGSLRLGLKLGGFPPLIFTDECHRHNHIYRTYCDAMSLHKDGDYEGAMYTAVSSVRLLLQIVAGLVRSERNRQRRHDRSVAERCHRGARWAHRMRPVKRRVGCRSRKV